MFSNVGRKRKKKDIDFKYVHFEFVEWIFFSHMTLFNLLFWGHMDTVLGLFAKKSSQEPFDSL